MSILDCNEKINNSEIINLSKINTDLKDFKEYFHLDENMIKTKRNSKIFKENNISNKKLLQSRTLRDNSLMVEKLFKRDLRRINGNSLMFDFDVIEIIWSSIFTCKKCRTNRFDIYEKAYYSINNNLHIYSYLKGIQDINTIKNAIFSLDEMKIIDFISKTIITNQVGQELFHNDNQLKNKLIYEKNLEMELISYEKILKHKKIKDNSKIILNTLSFQLENLTNDN